MTEKTFIDLVVEGKENENNISLYVDKWYTEPCGLPLSSFLGFTQDEYATWVMFPRYIKEVVKERLQQKTKSI